MTTATDADLDRWLAGEIEQTCEAHDVITGERCVQRADWLMSLSCCYARSRFTCTECKEACAEVPPRCLHCQGAITITWMERVR